MQQLIKKTIYKNECIDLLLYSSKLCLTFGPKRIFDDIFIYL